MGAQRTIGVAGCGVAGLACAALLARAGHRVVVYDKLSTPSPIGSGLILQPVGLAVLDALGAGDAIRERGAPIRRLYGRATPSQRVVLDVRYDALGRDAPHGLGVHRGALFQVLLDAAVAAGATLESNREIIAADAQRFSFKGAPHSPRFDLTIDALGMRSPLSRASTPLPFGALWTNAPFPAGFADDTLEQRYEHARKMAGVLPIGEAQAAFFWSLKGADHAAWCAASFDAWKDEVRALWPQTASLLEHVTRDSLVFARYAHRTLRSPLSDGPVHVGDSWHCASPQLGQGANMALLDAFALAHALAAQDDLAIALGEYERLRLWHIRTYQIASWLFTPAYQSDSVSIAFVRDHLMAPLSRIPPAPALLAALVSGTIGWPLASLPRS